ncbi:uncharacterized protein LOC142524892 isoform X1 [Primulina tabacum]|uniref:uncharacterized protein LOC142524892 isoform X1 n=1 Tax=Primulina tabacum TaxID=48773 RepID=UPI003F5A1D63
MQRNTDLQALAFPLSPFLLLNAVGGVGDLGQGGFELSTYLFLGSLLFSREGGGMDLSKVGEKIISSVRSARSLGLLPSQSDRPKVPARAAAAAAVARVLAGLPPHQRHTLSSSSEDLSSIYGCRPQAVVELEEEFFEEEFDPVRYILEQIPSEEIEPSYFEEKATLRLAQLDKISERLSRHIMEHHEEMVKCMNLVRELEKDLKTANVICMNGRRHLTSSRNEVSRDLIVTTNSRKKQALLDLLPILIEIGNVVNMQEALETLVGEGNFSKAFQILSEYLQLLDSLSGLSVVKEMTSGVEVWLGKTLQKLDSLLLKVCQDFKEDDYITVIDAYALIGDVSGLAEKIQSFFMQEALTESHSALRVIVLEDVEDSNMQNMRLTYSDLCLRIPESKFRQCLLATLSVLFKQMCSYYSIMSFQLDENVSSFHSPSVKQHSNLSGISHDSKREASSTFPAEECSLLSTARGFSLTSTDEPPEYSASSDGSKSVDHPNDEGRDNGSAASSSGSPWFLLRKDATLIVSHTLQRGQRNLWQLMTSRIAVLLSSSAVTSSSIHQFLRNYEDLSIFILAGEAFCGIEAVEFRQKLKSICEGYFVAFHRQNIYALKMVMEKENWQIMPPETIQVVSFAGLVGDGAALIISPDGSPSARLLHANRSVGSVVSESKRSGFSFWLECGNPFLLKQNVNSLEYSDSFHLNGVTTHGKSGNVNGKLRHIKISPESGDANHINGSPVSEDENDDLHADFIDEDSQLPSRISRPNHSRHQSSYGYDEDSIAQTGSSLSLLRLMDKYARLMQKLEIINVEFFKGICQLFGIFFRFVFETFCQRGIPPGGKGFNHSLPHKLKTALSRITQDYDQWVKPQSSPFSSASPASLTSLCHKDVTPTSPPTHLNSISSGLKERCAGADTLSLVAKLLHRSKAHLQSRLLQNNGAVVEDFYVHLVDAVPELTQQIHRTTARLLLHVDGYVDRIANAKWEVKELGLEHNGYVDLLLGEFKHYKTRLAHGGLRKEVQDLLLEYGLENIAETLIEGLSRVKRCTDEGRALMSLDLQVLINGLKHFVSIEVGPKLQAVETFIKAFYLPETEYEHWSRAHPEYSKTQIIGLVNLVATMKGWKRKTRLEVLEKIE